jgi:hypothetical protein
MRQVILSQNTEGWWGYLILVGGVLTHADPGPYDTPEDALHDAMACPTPVG